MVSRLLHFTHQVAGYEDRAALRRQLLHQVPEPEDAVGIQAVNRLIEEQNLRVPQERGGDAKPLRHPE